MNATVATLKRFAAMFEKKDKLKKELAKVEESIKSLEPDIVDYFQRHGKQKDEIGGRLLFLRRELWGSRDPSTEEDAFLEALDSAGLGHIAKRRANHQSLRSEITQFDKVEDNFPGQSFFLQHPELDGKLKVSEVFRIGCRKAAAKPKPRSKPLDDSINF